ncbi:MAG: septation protein SepH [Actinomyces sp.]|uniref:septation protein SepH n=1 Tax=Actinomyces sp. TaxID=29317 RepID=UPI0026DD9032|nr:septation protein SepH [Actinomyces sp.]MDO4243423.1 septation protein SepH [Actinomyces sp.]
MIELELLGANGDVVVMTDAQGERYSIIVDDALRAAVRRARPSALVHAPEVPAPGSTVRPRDLQALMRAGASAEEVAATTGLRVDHVRRFEGPVLAERSWAVGQAQACRIGWESDSPVLGELVVDRLATRGVEPSSLEWDALREGRSPWQVTLAFIQGAQVKHARWELDLTAKSVTALDDEARWLTEAAASRRPAVFDQDSTASGAVSGSSPGSARVGEEPVPQTGAGGPGPSGGLVGAAEDPTDALLADLASNRGRRLEVDPPEPSEDGQAPAEPGAPEPGSAEVVSMTDRRRALSANHPAGTRLPHSPGQERPPSEPDARTEEVPEVPTQEALPQMPDAPARRSRRQSRRSVPSWDEIVFGAKPE